ncbi:MAG: hypothetical protein Q9162_004377 [Coniocarpon cinnabarinum]
MLSTEALLVLASVAGLASGLGQQPIVSFQQCNGCVDFSNPRIVVDANDFYGVQRAAGDLAVDFGRVTGRNASFLNGTAPGSYLPPGSNNSVVLQPGPYSNGTSNSTGSATIVVGTLGSGGMVDSLVNSGALDVSQINGTWEAFQTQLIKSNMSSTPTLVIAGSDRRGSIYGIYDISEQIGVSPFYYWADVPTRRQDKIYMLPTPKIQPTPSIKYRGIFINDECPDLTGWVNANFPMGEYGPGYNHDFWELVFEMTLRLRGNYLWPTTWNSMFYVDDLLDPVVADQWGIVMGTSHTEPMTRQTKEQQLFLDGPWDWSMNEQNVIDFFNQGANRSKTYDTLYTMGMRGNGDAASPTLNSTSLQQIIETQQDILRNTFPDRSSLLDTPQMWCLYSEVGTYYQQGLQVPPEVTILWSDDNFGNARRLPLGDEVGRPSGSGLYYHVDFVGPARDYKWINTVNMPKTWQQLSAAYQRDAQQIWILNVGHLKGYEEPIQMFMDMAYNVSQFQEPTTVQPWLQTWATQQFGSDAAEGTADILFRYSQLAGRRKFESLDQNVYSPSNYNELDNVTAEWTQLVNDATAIYQTLPAAQQTTFWETILFQATAASNLHNLYRAVALNNLYAVERRSSTNAWAQQALNYFANDHNLLVQWDNLLGGKWAHLMDQTHIGYTYWQQPMRNTMPGLQYVQIPEESLAGPMGVSVEASNASVPGDDQYHTLSSQTLTLPPLDPYMPAPANRWIDVYSRGNTDFSWNVTSNATWITASMTEGSIPAPGGNETGDTRIYVSIPDWSAVPAGSSMVQMNFSLSTGDYGTQYGPPVVMVPVNNTAAPSDFSGFVESDAYLAFEAEHTTEPMTNSSSANLITIPGFGRTLSGVQIANATAPVQVPPDAPKMSYTFHSFTAPKNNTANVTVYMGAAQNTDTNNPMKYAIAVDSESPQIIQPVPTTMLGVFAPNWNNMVINAILTNTTSHSVMPGTHTLNLWPLNPGLVVEKIVMDLGGVRQSYLGPPESVRV